MSLNSLINALSSFMDSGEPKKRDLSLLGSNVYLSLILSPNSPVFTLFTPMAFVSLLRFDGLSREILGLPMRILYLKFREGRNVEEEEWGRERRGGKMWKRVKVKVRGAVSM